MQCGSICHVAARPEAAPHDLEVIPHICSQLIPVPPDGQIQDVFRHLAEDAERTEAIAGEISKAFCQGRKVLVLTERTDHIEAIRQAVEVKGLPVLVLHGRMSKKQRSGLIERLEAMPPDAPRILLATGKLIGEGFDHPPLDTLILAMPISWKGSLQQYAGRLHREHATKTDVRIIDFFDTGHPALLRMWDRRKRGYRAMDYKVVESVVPSGSLI
jgi:superfamily II DNA or RNA helicase